MTPPRDAAAPAFVAWSVARGRVLFNRADFWGSHEALEPAWRGAVPDEKLALQGLIQAAAAFHKLVVQDNLVGASRLIGRSLSRLEASSEDQFGLALGSFRNELEAWQRRLLGARDGLAPGPVVGLPRLEWTDRAAAERIVVDAVRLHEIVLNGRRAVLVALEADGYVGWGECHSSWGTHGLWSSLLEGVVPALLTEPVAAPSVAMLLWGDVTKVPSAISGVEFGLWDLWARMKGTSLCEAMGHPARAVPLAGRVPPGDVAVVAGSLDQLAGEGYQRLIVPARPNADRRVLPSLMAGCPVPLAVDLGGVYRLADLQALRVLDAMRPCCMMQPVPPEAIAHAGRLRRYLDSPISMGEWSSVEAIESAFELDTSELVHVDSARLGPTGVLCAAEIARYLSKRMWLASAAVTTVGALGDLALAAHPAMSEPSDLSRGWNEEGLPVVRPDSDGHAFPQAGPGLGYVPDPGWLESITRRRLELRA